MENRLHSLLIFVASPARDYEASFPRSTYYGSGHNVFPGWIRSPSFNDINLTDLRRHRFIFVSSFTLLLFLQTLHFDIITPPYRVSYLCAHLWQLQYIICKNFIRTQVKSESNAYKKSIRETLICKQIVYVSNNFV